MLSNKILKRFIKDYKLPISILEEPYFSYFLNLYNSTHNTLEKYKLLVDTVSKFNSEEEFLQHYTEIKEKIFDAVKSTKAYKEFNNANSDKYKIKSKISKNNIFNMGNVNKYFISIDLTKANFQAFKYFNKEIVLNCDTYDEFIGKFTDLEYIKNSKYIRQVIFGNMNPKKQIKIEKHMTKQILDLLLNNFELLKKENIKMFMPDEIIFELPYKIAQSIPQLVYLHGNINHIVEKELGFDINIEIYKLRNIGNSEKYFVKEFLSKSGEELMCIPKLFYPQIYKKYYNLKLEDYDLLFFHENQIAKFLKPLDLE